VSILGALLSWWGLWLIAAMDSTMIFFLPLGVDVAVVILVTRTPDLVWFYPIVAMAGSICGAAITYYVGRRVGEAGLDRFVPKRKLDRFRRRIEEKGAVALAVLDLLPPPFPFTACVLAAGALKVNKTLFFVALALTRLVRFGGEAVLAYFYGRHIVSWLESPTLEYIGVGFVVAAIVGSIITTVQVVRKSRNHHKQSRKKSAA
jgi:membrane protein DedA with SNARE-associated domain